MLNSQHHITKQTKTTLTETSKSQRNVGYRIVQAKRITFHLKCNDEHSISQPVTNNGNGDFTVTVRESLICESPSY